MRVWDQNGKEHIDGVSGGVWTVNVGYGRESIANAVRDQLLKLNYFAGAAGSVPGALFAEKLIEKCRDYPEFIIATQDLRPTKKLLKWFAKLLIKNMVVKK